MPLKKIHITPEQEAFIKENAKTMCLIDFAKKYNVSYGTIRRWKIYLGINDEKKKTREKPKPKAEKYTDYFSWGAAKKTDFILKKL